MTAIVGSCCGDTLPPVCLVWRADLESKVNVFVTCSPFSAGGHTLNVLTVLQVVLEFTSLEFDIGLQQVNLIVAVLLAVDADKNIQELI